MNSAQRKSRPSTRSLDRSVYTWAAGAALVAAAAYAVLASATLRDTIDGLPVSAIDAAWPYWAATAAVTLLAGALAQAIIQLARPRLPARAAPDRLPSLEDQRRGRLAWVVPAAVTLAAALLVRLSSTTLAAVGGGVAVLVGTFLTVVAHYHLRDERATRRSIAGSSLLLLTYASAFFLLTVIYSNKWRSMYSATAIALATMLLLLQLTDGEEIAWLRRLLYALVGGLLLGQVTWPLNYWAATGPIGGALLLVCFHLVAGTMRDTLRGSFGRREVAEYVAVCGVALAIIAFSVSAYR